MAKRKKHAPVSAARGTVRSDPPIAVEPAAPLPRDIHGPQTAARALYGLDHLRTILKQSASVSIDDLCEEAALTIEQLRFDRPPRARWRD